AMLRVSSYRKLFEEQEWRRSAGRCGFQARSALRADVSARECSEPDFAAFRTLNKEGAARFVSERSIIATLNDRLAVLIDVVHSLEEENESLEAQIIRLESESSSTAVSIRGPADYSLEAVIERLRRENEAILCDAEELNGELQRLQMKYDEVVEQRTLLQLERGDVSVEVDAITTDCLALQEQVAIYEEQLAAMERQHETRVENLREHRPVDESYPMVSLQFPAVDITPTISDIKEYYSELAKSLKFESRAVRAVAADAVGMGKLAKPTGGKVKDVSKETDVNVLKDLIAELQKELAELEMRGDELEAEVEARRAKYLEEIDELENYICQLEEEEADLNLQMKEQCEDNEELLNQKMALDIEIALIEDICIGLCYCT
ncbi:putative vimentin-like, partial [Triplophysa rosa]